MTFNPDAKIDSSKVSKRGRNTAISVGAGGGMVLLLAILGPLLGVDLSGLAPLLGGDPGTSQQQPDESLDHCQTGADAQEDVECRMVGAATSLDVYWEGQFPSTPAYATPGFVVFEGSTSTACGTGSAATGPFYCPTDQTIYIDVSFFDDLRNRFGAQGGTLSEMYVVAHEWGHHVQNLLGTMDRLNLRESGPDSDSVRLELQADCYAGAWAAAASTVPDESGQPLLKPVTQQQVADALNAASVIGDDRIQETSGMQVNPHTWTHGSSEQRQQAFLLGFQENTPNACSALIPNG